MSDIKLKNITYKGDFDNPAYEDPTNGAPPSHKSSVTAIDVDIPKNNNFSPNHHSGAPEDEEQDHSDCEFEDLDPLENPMLQKLKDVQDAFWGFTDENWSVIRIIFIAIFVLLYFAYFIYAMVYHFGDEGSITLLVVTMLVVFGFVCWFLLTHTPLRDAISKCMEALQPYGTTINYILLAVVYLFIVVFVIVDLVVVTKNYYNLVSISGIVVYVLLFFIFSVSPAHVNWRAVLWGLALQFILAIFILRSRFGYNAFSWIGDLIDAFLSHTDAGSIFLFGTKFTDHYFAFKVLPVIVFFSSAVSVLFYLGWMQVIIKAVAWVMQISMGTTAGESLNAAGNIFIGQSEAPLLIRPLLPDMTPSEIHAVMTGGFATIAGSVLAAYILMGVPANHLITASVMSAPAALAMSKLFYPETKKSRTKAEDIDKFEKVHERNIIEAISAGASASISLVANIAANLIAFIAMLNFVNSLLTWFGRRVGDYGYYPPTHEDITLEWFCSYILWPFALIMGTDIADCRNIAQLIGIKTILNEFVAYDFLGKLKANTDFYNHAVTHNYTTEFMDRSVLIYGGANFINITELPEDQAILMANTTDVLLKNGIMTQRSIVIGTYALCGFANFGSMGVMLGALGAMAPTRKKDLARVVMRAMIAGNVACFMTAGIAGLFYNGEFDSN